MKQHITKEQWEELSEELRIELATQLAKIWGNYTTPEMPTIGHLIEFLEDDLRSIDKLKGSSTWIIEITYDSDSDEILTFQAEELIDVLWEATKFKINNK